MTYFNSQEEVLDGKTWAERGIEGTEPRRHIDFDSVNEAALERVDEVLEHWLPEGKCQGKEYLAINPNRLDSDLGSFSINTQNGLWSDFATGDKGGDLISLVAFVMRLDSQYGAAVELERFLAGLDVQPVPRSAGAKQKVSPKWEAILPVPDSAPPAPSQHFELGKPVATWIYRNQSGQVLGLVMRFLLADGKKTMRPLTYCRNAQGKQEWRWQALPTPRPLYGLEKLGMNPEAIVMLCEGEKCADAAQRLFPDYVCVAFPNGVESTGQVDWNPITGRKVIFWPDNDEAGRTCADKVVACIRSLNAAAEISVFQIPAGKPNKWDAADALVEGMTGEQLLLLGGGAVATNASEILVAHGEQVTAPEQTACSVESDKQAKNKKSKPPLINQVNEFLLSSFGSGIVYLNDTFYGYGQGYWPQLHERADVRQAILKHLGAGATPDLIGAFLSMAKDKTSVKELVAPNRNLICLNNGTLDPLTGDLLSHSPAHNLRTALEFNWDPKAVCPRWTQFIDEIFAGDADAVERKIFIQQWFGYCLIPDTSQEKFLWLVGKGGNGKSKLLNVLTKLVGDKNVSGSQISELGKDFVRAELEGKLINISFETSITDTIADGYLKQIVSGDPIQAAAKYKAPYSFRPFARIVGATNELPRLLDSSEGFARRAVILDFNRQFKGKNDDKGLEQKLLAELPGILVWAVKGLQDLRQRGSFVVPASTVESLENYRTESDPVKQYADAYLTVDENSRGVTSETLYERYKTWADKYGYARMNVGTFSKKLKGHGFVKLKSGGTSHWLVQISSEAPEPWEHPLEARYPAKAEPRNYSI